MIVLHPILPWRSPKEHSGHCLMERNSLVYHSPAWANIVNHEQDEERNSWNFIFIHVDNIVWMFLVQKMPSCLLSNILILFLYILLIMGLDLNIKRWESVIYVIISWFGKDIYNWLKRGQKSIPLFFHDFSIVKINAKSPDWQSTKFGIWLYIELFFEQADVKDKIFSE